MSGLACPACNNLIHKHRWGPGHFCRHGSGIKFIRSIDGTFIITFARRRLSCLAIKMCKKRSEEGAPHYWRLYSCKGLAFNNKAFISCLYNLGCVGAGLIRVQLRVAIFSSFCCRFSLITRSLKIIIANLKHAGRTECSDNDTYVQHPLLPSFTAETYRIAPSSHSRAVFR